MADARQIIDKDRDTAANPALRKRSLTFVKEHDRNPEQSQSNQHEYAETICGEA